ncbi:MAG TPA: GDP-mannose 4,6-dehydratase [Acidobacteriota bacterium]|nr:GDP-mannose 4,6-dehydratase [Acidobacteriota bacterium]
MADSRGGQRPRTWLVTGAAGFIGSHLVEALLGQGEQVLGLDNLSTGRIDNLEHLLEKPGFRFARADVFDEAVLDRLASEADVLVHLAAAVGVKLIVESPVHTIETNVRGTENVLQAALRYGCRVLLASTSEVYGKGAQIPFREDDDVLLGPTCRSRWAYAASKMIDEFLGLAYHSEYGLPLTIFRLFNTVGPRQTGAYGMVVPRFVEQALRGEEITVYGDGNQKRVFCDVSDAVRGILALAEHDGAVGGVFNIGGEEEISMFELAERIREVTASASSIIKVPYEEAYSPGFEDMQRRLPSTDRMRELTGWAPNVSLSEILARVTEHERTRLADTASDGSHVDR